MTTSKSNPAKLKWQADNIAATMKKAERGESTDRRVIEARKKPTFKTGIVMDDKVLVIEFEWDIIRDTEQDALSEFVLKHMQGATEN